MGAAGERRALINFGLQLLPTDGEGRDDDDLDAALSWLEVAARLDDIGRAWWDQWWSPTPPDLLSPAARSLLLLLKGTSIWPALRGRLSDERTSATAVYALRGLLAAGRAELRAALEPSILGLLNLPFDAAWAPPLRRWAEEVRAALDRVETIAALHALACLWRPPRREPTSGDLRRDIEEAIAFLDRDPMLTGAWEVQRWGLGLHDEPLVEQIFPASLVLLALWEAGARRPASLLRAFEAAEPDNLRWYGSWQGIPPDADSLGMMLSVAALLPDRPTARVEGWLRLLAPNVDPAGATPVWFTRWPDGRPTLDEPIRSWPFDRCATVRGHLLLGLLAWDPPGHARLIEANLALLLRQFDDEPEHGDLFYSAPYARLIFHRVVDRLPAGLVTPELEAAVTARRQLDREAWANEQRADGSFGSPMKTAFALESLASDPTAALVAGAARRYLSGAQHPDGSWAAEDFYRMPGKSLDNIVYYRSVEVTTALCVRAMSLRPLPAPEKPLPPCV